MTTDASIARAVNEAAQDAEMDELLANRPQWQQPVRSDESNDLEPNRTRALTSTASEIHVWNRETGVASIVIFDAIKARMRQRFPADHPNPAMRGAKVYTLHPAECDCGEAYCDPAPMAYRGTIPCTLSMDNPDRQAQVVTLGYGAPEYICTKPPIFTSTIVRDRHVRKSHKEFWEATERFRQDSRDAEDRAERAAMRQALTVLAGGETPTRQATARKKPFAQLNRAELQQMAWDVGVLSEDEEFGEEVTNAQIRDAIKAHQEGSG